MTQTQSGPLWDGVLEQLQAEQERSSFISAAFMEQVAEESGLSLGEVYGVATFYHFLATAPQGRYILRVCKSLPCALKSAQGIIETIQAKLGIGPGETTPDGKFSLQLTNCIGACDQAPAMLVNYDLHGHLTPEAIHHLIDECL